MNKIKIVVATHKKYWMPDDDMYIPVHVGREGKQDLGYVGDNTGDNISEKNNTWCELTGLYWAWKNLDCAYLGIVQYRRHFKGRVPGKKSSILSREEVETLLKNTSIIVPKPRNYVFMSLEEHFNGYDFTIPTDIENVRKAIHAVSPEYDKAFDTVMKRHKGHMFNMFIMRRDYLNDFCEWEFAVLEYLEKIIDHRRSRLIGYIAEHMLDVWLEKNKYEFFECKLALLDKKNDIYRRIDFICRKLGISHRFIKTT